jgi:hypothetical protein
MRVVVDQENLLRAADTVAESIDLHAFVVVTQRIPMRPSFKGRLRESGLYRRGMPHREPIAKEIEQIHDSIALWEATIPVREVVGGNVWNGKVEVYVLVGHDKARRCYAWRSETAAGEERLHVVLEVPPINSAADAVRATIRGS